MDVNILVKKKKKKVNSFALIIKSIKHKIKEGNLV